MAETTVEAKREVKNGTLTTEYKLASSVDKWSTLMTALGSIGAVLSVVANAMGHDSTTGIIAGAVAAIIGIIVKAMNSLGYGKARASVKSAAPLLLLCLVPTFSTGCAMFMPSERFETRKAELATEVTDQMNTVALAAHTVRVLHAQNVINLSLIHI